MNKILSIKLNYIDLNTTQRIFDAVSGNNFKPYTDYNKFQLMKNFNVKLKEEIVNNDTFSLKLQKEPESNFKITRNNINAVASVVCAIFGLLYIGLNCYYKK